MRFIQKGFTIVELLVVIVVIGILAGIVIVNYNGIQARANDGAVTSDLTNFSDQLEIYRTRSGASDRYPSSGAELQTLDIKLTRSAYRTEISDNVIVCMAGDYKTFTIIALSKSGNVLAATKDGMTSYTQPASTFGTTACSSVYSLSALSSGWSSGSWQSWVD